MVSVGAAAEAEVSVVHSVDDVSVVDVSVGTAEAEVSVVHSVDDESVVDISVEQGVDIVGLATPNADVVICTIGIVTVDVTKVDEASTTVKVTGTVLVWVSVSTCISVIVKGAKVVVV